MKKKATHRGRPAVKSKRAESVKDDIFGFMRGEFEFVGDIESPIPDWNTPESEGNSGRRVKSRRRAKKA